MQAKTLPNADTSYLDRLFFQSAWDGDERVIGLRESGFYKDLNHTHIQLWCSRNARYNLPTIELVDWLRTKIAGRQTIEVAAGMGDLAYHLGIPGTDSYMQSDPAMKMYYEMLGTNTTTPPEFVQKFDAVDAVKQLKPQVVVACWLTQKIPDEEFTPDTQGSVFGADELEIIKSVECYIHVGNEAVHGKKNILTLPHEEFRPPWLVSRGFDQSKNIIYTWGK